MLCAWAALAQPFDALKGSRDQHFQRASSPRTEDVNDCPELRDIAAIYADHEDYAPKWSATP